MTQFISSFTGYSTDNLEQARVFYVATLGLSQNDNPMGLSLSLPGGGEVFIYEKKDHLPATFTVLNLIVENIDTAVDEMKAKGIVFERYDLGNGAVQDDKDILRGLAANMGPDIAWFKDTAGNILAVIQDK